MHVRKINPVTEIIREANEKIYWNGEEIDVFNLFSLIRSGESDPFIRGVYKMRGFSIPIHTVKESKGSTPHIIGGIFHDPIDIHKFINILHYDGLMPAIVEVLSAADTMWYNAVEVRKVMMDEDLYVFNLSGDHGRTWSSVEGLQYRPGYKHNDVHEGHIYYTLGEKDVQIRSSYAPNNRYNFSSTRWYDPGSTYILYFLKGGRLYCFMGSRVPSVFKLWSGKILIDKNHHMEKELTSDILNENNCMFYIKLDSNTYILTNGIHDVSDEHKTTFEPQKFGLLIKTDSDAFKDGFEYMEECDLAKDITYNQLSVTPINIDKLTLSKTEDGKYKIGVIYGELRVDYDRHDKDRNFTYYNGQEPRFNEVESIFYRKLKIGDSKELSPMMMIHSQNWEKDSVEMCLTQAILKDLFDGQVNKIKTYLRSMSYLPISFLTETIIVHEDTIASAYLCGRYKNYKDYITENCLKSRGNKIIQLDSNGEDIEVYPKTEIEPKLFHPSEEHLASSKEITMDTLRDYVCIFGLLMPFRYFDSKPIEKGE